MGIKDHVNVEINGPNEAFSSLDNPIDYDRMPFYVCVESSSFTVDEGDSFTFNVYIYRNTPELSDDAVIAHTLPTVTYTITGTAINGTDYTLLSGNVPFDQNETFFDSSVNRRGHVHEIEVDVFSDVPVDDLETIIITINSSDNYIVSDPAPVTSNSTPGTFTTVINDMSTPTYATLNPSDKHSSITLSNGNLTAAGDASDGGGNTRLVRANMEMTSEKWYFEATINSGNYGGGGVGANSGLMTTIGGGANASFTHTYEDSDSGVLDTTDNGNGGSNPYNGSTSANGGATIAFLLDLDLNLLTIRNASTGNNLSSNLGLDADDNMPLATFRNFFAGQVTFNFGASAFVGTVPSGYHKGYGLNVPIQP